MSSHGLWDTVWPTLAVYVEALTRYPGSGRAISGGRSPITLAPSFLQSYEDGKRKVSRTGPGHSDSFGSMFALALLLT